MGEHEAQGAGRWKRDAGGTAVNVAVVGYGYWGPNLARNFSSLEGASLRAVCEVDARLLKKARESHPLASMTGDFDAMLEDDSIDAVCIATPAATHGELALRALRAGRHVLVEKPMATSSAQCEAMAEEADKRGLVLMVDYPFVYCGAVRKLAELVSTGALGNLYYFDSVRINLGIVQSDVNVLWDLAVHDLSILHRLGWQRPVSVSASGVSHIDGGLVDTAYLTLHYDSSFIAHVHVSWLAPTKIRRTTVAGDRSMAIWDDTESTEKLKIYDSGVDMKSADREDVNRLLVEYRAGDIHVPRLDATEPLALLAAEFRDAVGRGVRGGATPLTGAEEGARIVRVVEAADASIRRNGERIPL